jgi:hypothetical protein
MGCNATLVMIKIGAMELGNDVNASWIFVVYDIYIEFFAMQVCKLDLGRSDANFDAAIHTQTRVVSLRVARLSLILQHSSGKT